MYAKQCYFCRRQMNWMGPWCHVLYVYICELHMTVKICDFFLWAVNPINSSNTFILVRFINFRKLLFFVAAHIMVFCKVFVIVNKCNTLVLKWVKTIFWDSHCVMIKFHYTLFSLYVCYYENPSANSMYRKINENH